MTSAIWTLIASILATAITSAAALYFKVRRDRLKAQLEFVNDQLRYFYGPMLANVEATQQAYKIFIRRYNPQADRSFWSSESSPSSEAIAAWHHWVTTLFMPINELMVSIISNRSDLLIAEAVNGHPGASDMPNCLIDLCSHVHTLRAELATWKRGPKDARIPEVPYYPADELLPYLRSSFSHLKTEQVRLLKATTASKKYPITQDKPIPALIGERKNKTHRQLSAN